MPDNASGFVECEECTEECSVPLMPDVASGFVEC